MSNRAAWRFTQWLKSSLGLRLASSGFICKMVADDRHPQDTKKSPLNVFSCEKTDRKTP